MENEKGVWRTVRGRRVFIRDGESLGSAMARSGKFKRSDIRETKEGLSQADRFDKENNKALKSKLNEKQRQKEIHKMQNKSVKYSNSVYSPISRQDEKLIADKDANIEGSGKTRVQRNWNRYSEEQRREVRHEEIQKKLADYKAKKQSNNKVETWEEKVKRLEKENAKNKNYEIPEQSNNKVDPYDDPESNESQRLQSIQSRYDEYLQDTEGRGASYGEIAYVESLRGKDLDDFEKELDDYEEKKYNKQETIKNYTEKKKSNNAQTTNKILERSGKVNQKTLKSYADDGLATDITRYSDKDIDKLEKKHGRLTHLKTSMGTYGMNGALLKSEKTGEYFVITARNGNLFRLV